MMMQLKLTTLATAEAVTRDALYRIKEKVKFESHSMYQCFIQEWLEILSYLLLLKKK